MEHCVRENWAEILLAFLPKIDGWETLSGDQRRDVLEAGFVAVNDRKGNGITTIEALDACRAEMKKYHAGSVNQDAL